MRFLTFECLPSVDYMLSELADRPGRFILEDVLCGTAIIGAAPNVVLTAKNDVVQVERQGEVTEIHGDPLRILAERLADFEQNCNAEHIPFAGGAVGYFSYDLGRSIEDIPSIAKEDIPAPDYCLGFYDSALIVDLANRRCTAVSWSGDPEAIEDWRKLAISAPRSEEAAGRSIVHCSDEPAEVTSNFTKAEYLAAIERIREYIAAGDVYQVNLSQRFEAKLPSTALELYKALRRINPAPESCYIEIGPITLVSASPELFLSYDPVTRRVVTKPIKGTRPRGHTPQEDALLAHELATSEKDRAENLMIVDMERNDLGRVAKYGTVRVPKLWDIEEHPNVFQMVSTVEAELASDYGPIDLLRASFPGGSITGAPKIRAMEIIEELEPHRRGLYTGSAGYIDFRGRMHLNIIIRSFAVHGSTAYFHAGGGIVIDSDPQAEYQETVYKIAGLRRALQECEKAE